MITPELIELQQRTDEAQNIMFESQIRSSGGIEQCPVCEEYYFRVGGHVCEKRIESVKAKGGLRRPIPGK